MPWIFESVWQEGGGWRWFGVVAMSLGTCHFGFILSDPIGINRQKSLLSNLPVFVKILKRKKVQLTSILKIEKVGILKTGSSLRSLTHIPMLTQCGMTIAFGDVLWGQNVIKSDFFFLHRETPDLSPFFIWNFCVCPHGALWSLSSQERVRMLCHPEEIREIANVWEDSHSPWTHLETWLFAVLDNESVHGKNESICEFAIS